MTPKGKAIELYNKFMTMPYPTHIDRAKQCALIAVDEIINSNPVEQMTFLNGVRSNIPYWEEVKKEIETL